MLQPPDRPKIYHILHVDRLASVVDAECLWCDAVITELPSTGSSIGMPEIKNRRLHKLVLRSRPNLHVGECVPFYFCPRSVMLYIIAKANHPGLEYRGGQGPIVHLEADLHETVLWANGEGLRWAFTLSNAGAYYFEDRSQLSQLQEVNWPAIEATKWSGTDVPDSVRHGKQAEFLVEQRFPWHLVRRIGVFSKKTYEQAAKAVQGSEHRPKVEILQAWYY